MSKSDRYREPLWVFPLLFFLTPLLVFGADALIRYIQINEFSFEIVKSKFVECFFKANYREYLFAAILYPSLILTIMLLKKIANGKISGFGWVLFSMIGLLAFLFANRILYYITHVHSGFDFAKVYEFLADGVSLFSVTRALMITFLINAIVKWMDVVFLRK